VVPKSPEVLCYKFLIILRTQMPQIAEGVLCAGVSWTR